MEAESRLIPRTSVSKIGALVPSLHPPPHTVPDCQLNHRLLLHWSKVIKKEEMDGLGRGRHVDNVFIVSWFFKNPH